MSRGMPSQRALRAVGNKLYVVSVYDHRTCHRTHCEMLESRETAVRIFKMWHDARFDDAGVAMWSVHLYELESRGEVQP